MIELMLEAERALAVGLLDQAERHYAQVVAADPRNAIAIVGLARVALERGDQRATYSFARRALALDPDNPAASHLAHRMAEQMQIRGERLPDDEPGPGPSVPISRAPAGAPPPTAGAPGAPRESTGSAPDRADRPGLLDRFRRRR